MNLRELTHDQEAILHQVSSGDFNLEDVSDHLELLESERNDKIENYLHVINRLNSECNTIADEVKRLEIIRDGKANALDRVKSWLLMSMKDGEKHQFDLFKVSRVKGREVLSITDSDFKHADYVTFKSVKSIDKRLLLSTLKAGVEIDGAEITTGNPSLRIK